MNECFCKHHALFNQLLYNLGLTMLAADKGIFFNKLALCFLAVYFEIAAKCP